MQTVGQILKNARLEKGVSLEQIENETKINKRFLEALENSNYQKLPPPTFIKGFVKNYGEYLGLPVTRLLALFRREYSLSSPHSLVPKTAARFLSPSLWDIVQNKLFLTATFFLLVLFLVFLGRGFLIPPPLVLDSPVDNLVTSQLSVAVAGQTQPETRVSINDQEITLQEDGSFSVRVQLTVGVNRIVVVATNKLGRSQKIIRTVTVSP